MFSKYVYGAISLLILNFVTIVSSLDKNIIIPLNKTLTKTNKQLYDDFFYINNSSTLQIDFENINKNVSFIILQVHSHLHNVMVHNGRLESVYGTNIGMYSSVDLKNSSLDTFFVVNSNENMDLKLYISVNGYKATDPIPGGCPMEDTILTSPHIRVTNKNDYVVIDAAPPKSPTDINCMSVDVDIKFYMLYLPEGDLGPDVYFEGIKSMLTFEGIRANGTILPKYWQFWNMRRAISAYRGTGAIYVAVARIFGSKPGYSVYVPSYSYSCTPLEHEDCELIKDEFSKFLCAILLFTGVFICYMGHRFFKTEMFLVGFSSGFLITYIMITLMDTGIDRPALIAASALSGIFYGLGWLTFWWLYGIPVVSVLLSSLNLGFIVASVTYYVLPAENDYLRRDVYFWCFFVLIMLISALPIVLATFFGNIVCCSVLGACAAVYPIDLYLGSNLKYIVINALRRAVVPGFRRVLLMPPFQKKDVCVVVLWVMLVATGVTFQYYYNRNRPPFPPPPRSVRPEPPMYGAIDDRSQQSVEVEPTTSRDCDEKTPLLS